MMELRQSKVWRLSVIAIFMISMLLGCTPQKETPNENKNANKWDEKYPMEVVDDMGNKIRLAHRPERIISLAPSHTEILYGLGLGDKVIGVTQYCDYPSEAKLKPKVGDSFTIDLEKVIELQPDVVIQYWGMNDELRKQLEDAGIPLLTYSPESIAETFDTIRKIGIVTGTEDAAKKMLSDMKKKMREIEKIVKDAPKVLVFYEIEYSSALWTAGKGSFIDEIISLGGGENIAADAQGAYAQYSVEALVEKDPEIYVTNTFNTASKNFIDLKSRPGFENLTAVKDNNIKILDGNILSRPSQRVVEALELMAKALHPELFKQ